MANTKRSAQDVWTQGQADVDQTPECQQLWSEIAPLTGDDGLPGAKLPLLADATQRWLRRAHATATVKLLKKQQVAMPDSQGEIQWFDLLAEGEDDPKRHPVISRWLQGKGKGEANCPFSIATVRRLYWCAVQHEYWRPPARSRRRSVSHHEYYHQLLAQLDSTATTRGNLHREAPGVYQCFRPSVIYPGRYVVGLFAVALLPDHPPSPSGHAATSVDLPDVLRTVELHRIAPDDEPEQGRKFDLKLIQAPGVEEVFTGYMVKKSRQVLVHAFNSITCSFQYTVISDFLLSEPMVQNESYTGIPRRERASLQMASGITVGLVGQVGFYSVPTVLLRLNNLDVSGVNSDDDIIALMRDSMEKNHSVGIFPADSIPDFVRQQFQVISRQVVLNGS